MSAEFEEDRVPREEIEANWPGGADEQPEEFEEGGRAADEGEQDPAGDYLDEQDSDGPPAEDPEAVESAGPPWPRQPADAAPPSDFGVEVIVHTVASRDGAISLRRLACTASVSQAKTFRSWRRQVSMTVNMRSTNRLPEADCVPNDSFRQITA